MRNYRSGGLTNHITRCAAVKHNRSVLWWHLHSRCGSNPRSGFLREKAFIEKDMRGVKFFFFSFKNLQLNMRFEKLRLWNKDYRTKQWTQSKTKIFVTCSSTGWSPSPVAESVCFFFSFFLVLVFWIRAWRELKQEMGVTDTFWVTVQDIQLLWTAAILLWDIFHRIRCSLNGSGQIIERSRVLDFIFRSTGNSS